MCIIDGKKIGNSKCCLTLRLLLLIFLCTVMPNPLFAQVINTYGPIKTGDKLWDIAEKVRPDATVSRHQMIVALLKVNPQAFRVPCNIQSLQIGYTLSVPPLAVIQSVSEAEAIAMLARFHREKPTTCSLTESPPPVTATVPAVRVSKTPESPKETKNVSVTHLPMWAVFGTIENWLSPALKLPVTNDFLTIGSLFLAVFTLGWLLQKYTAVKKISQENQKINTLLHPENIESLDIPKPSGEKSTQSSVAVPETAENIPIPTKPEDIFEKNQTNWQELIETNKNLPMQQYMPENKAKIFDLVDKVFELLDKELHAQGQLVEAYKSGHRQEFFTTDDPTQKTEKTLIEEPVANQPQKLRKERKPTRYL